MKPGMMVGKPGPEIMRGTAHISFDTAETLTGITHQQVSRWRNSLRDELKYREVLFGPSYKKAMAGAAEANQLVQPSSLMPC